MARWLFYLNYAYRNLRRGGRWTTLAVLCIAAGVATVVALRGLGLSIGDVLVSTVRQDNKGDIRLAKPTRGGEAFATFFTFSEDAAAFTPNEVAAVQARVTALGGRMAAFTSGGGGFQVTAVDAETVGRPQSVSALFIDPATYPATHQITALDPAGVPLSALYTAGLDLVISENLAQQQQLRVGSTVRVSGSTEIFTVRGIVATANEAGVRNAFAAFFGFAYVELADARAALGRGIDPNTIGIALDNPPTDVALQTLVDELRTLASRESGATNARTAERLLQASQTIAQLLGDFIVVLGLGALLIGGVGIMNTMLVMVRRRTIEIAALKTFGLKGRQVAALFLAEGLLLGIFGSALGCVIGLLLGGIVNRYGEAFLQQPIPWKIYPEALVYGAALGLVIAVIFGLAPILTALQIRPGIILRPTENHLPRTSVLQTLALMLIITLSIGLVVGQIIRPSFGLTSRFSTETPYLAGILGVAATLLFLGLLVLLLWGLVWLVGRLPTFDSVTLRLALKNLSTNRLRTATTLLALSAGMFALSSISFVGEGTRELLNLQLAQQFGGNVLVFPLAPGSLRGLATVAINNAVRDVPGIEARTTIAFYGTGLLAVDGQTVENALRVTRTADGRRRFSADEGFDALDPADTAPFIWGSVTVWDSTNPAIYANQRIVAGRNLTPEDRGRRVLLGPAQFAAPLGIQVGSILTYNLGGTIVDYEVVGLTETSFGLFSGNNPVFPPDSITTLAPDFQLFTLQVQPEHLNKALVELSTIRIPPTFALDVAFLDSLLGRLITQFAAIPTVVGILSLFAAAVIMANTVALATLERQRQIGILKSIGLKSRRVLRVMMLETGLIGLLSAILGIGLSSLFVTLLTGLSGTPIPLPADARLLTVVLVTAALLIALLATFLSAGVAVRERVMNVLRYE